MLGAFDKTTAALRDELADCQDKTRILSAQLAAKTEQLDRITSSLGWRLLSRYGPIKYKYLMPRYRLFGRGVVEVPLQQNEREILEPNEATQVDEGKQACEASSNTSDEPTASSRCCVLCGKSVEAWLPLDIPVSDFIRLVGSVGSNIQRFSCPHCASSDRDRHLRLFLEQVEALERIKGGSVLHMAPEPTLEAYIRSYAPSFYVRGDLNPSDQSVLRINLQRLPFRGETLDLVICNHVLEHVDKPIAALREIRRVLKPGARVICQTPFATRLTNTLEDPLLQSTDDRIFLYGQDDHVRLFGRDLESLIRQAGFVGRIVPHEEILPDVDPEVFGVNEQEPFFDFERR